LNDGYTTFDGLGECRIRAAKHSCDGLSSGNERVEPELRAPFLVDKAERLERLVYLPSAALPRYAEGIYVNLN